MLAGVSSARPSVHSASRPGAFLPRLHNIGSTPERASSRAESASSRTECSSSDERLDGPTSIGVEAETRPNDLQAVERSISAKKRDSGVQRMALLVSSTERNLALVRQHLPALRQTFPLATRGFMAAIRDGRDPGADALVLL
jgi:hypothetical protein